MISPLFLNSGTSLGFAAGGVTVTSSVTTLNSTGCLVVCVELWQDIAGTGTVSGVTANGIALTSASAITLTTMRSEIWYLKNPPTGTFNVIMTTAGNTDDRKIAVIHLQGADILTGLGATTTSSSSGSSVSGTLTIKPGAAIVDCAACFGTANGLVANTPQTSFINDISGSTTIACSFYSNNTGASTTVGWTKTGTNDLAYTVASFLPSAGNTPNRGLRPHPFSPGLAR